MEDLIKTIHIDKANLDYISETGVINGTLLAEIKRVMREYANVVSDSEQKELLEKAYNAGKHKEGEMPYNNDYNFEQWYQWAKNQEYD